MSHNTLHWVGVLGPSSIHFKTQQLFTEDYRDGPILRIRFSMALIRQKNCDRAIGVLAYDVKRVIGIKTSRAWYTTVQTRNGPRREGIPYNARFVVEASGMELRVDKQDHGWWVGLSDGIPGFFAVHLHCTKDHTTGIVKSFQFSGFTEHSFERAEMLMDYLDGV